MKKHKALDGTKIYEPGKKISPSGQTNIITDPNIIHGEFTASTDENAELARDWVNDIKL